MIEQEKTSIHAEKTSIQAQIENLEQEKKALNAKVEAQIEECTSFDLSYLMPRSCGCSERVAQKGERTLD